MQVQVKWKDDNGVECRQVTDSLVEQTGTINWLQDNWISYEVEFIDEDPVEVIIEWAENGDTCRLVADARGDAEEIKACINRLMERCYPFEVRYNE